MSDKIHLTRNEQRACDFEENSPLAEDLEAAAQALQQAREIERLKMQLHDSHVSHAKSLLELGNRTIRLGELEAERDKLRETLSGMFVKTGAAQG